MALTVAIACTALTAAVVFVMLRTGWAGAIALDRPNERSLHGRDVPRSGGIVLISIAMLPALALPVPAAALALMTLLLMAVSAVDDRRGLPVVARLLAHVALAAAAVLLLNGAGTLWTGALLVLAIVWSINAYNFMDGSDGMAGGMAVIGFGCYAVQAFATGRAELALTSAAVAGASLGFLFFNFAPARLFMGDAGSVPLGFLAAALGLLGWKTGAWDGWFPLVVFSAFLVDASATLLRRLLRGERVWLAHKEHLYQRMVASGLGHTRTALAAYGIMTLSAAVALTAERLQGRTAAGFAFAWIAACALLHFVCARRFRTT